MVDGKISEPVYASSIKNFAKEDQGLAAGSTKLGEKIADNSAS
jgi:hypothetical protein